MIAISQPVERHLHQDFGVDPEKIHLVPNGIDLDRFVMTDEQKRRDMRKKWHVNSGQVIGIIARLSDVKGIDILIQAMPRVLKEIPAAYLMIVGQGPRNLI